MGQRESSIHRGRGPLATLAKQSHADDLRFTPCFKGAAISYSPGEGHPLFQLWSSPTTTNRGALEVAAKAASSSAPPAPAPLAAAPLPGSSRSAPSAQPCADLHEFVLPPPLVPEILLRPPQTSWFNLKVATF